jgi:hypothetical protein
MADTPRKRSDKYVRTGSGKQKGAVVPRPYMIARSHSGGVASPHCGVAMVQGFTNNPTTTADGGRALDVVVAFTTMPFHSLHPIAYGPSTTQPQTKTTTGALAPTNYTAAAENRRIWGLEEALGTSTTAGYNLLAPCAADSVFYIDVEPTRITQTLVTEGSTGIEQTAINMNPFYVLCVWHPGNIAGPIGTHSFASSDIDELRRIPHTRLWKVVPNGDKPIQRSFRWSCHDVLKTMNLGQEEAYTTSGLTTEANAESASYRYFATTLAHRDSHTISATDEMVVSWYIVAEQLRGMATGLTSDDSRYEVRVNCKAGVQQKWLFYDQAEILEPDAT